MKSFVPVDLLEGYLRSNHWEGTDEDEDVTVFKRAKDSSKHPIEIILPSNDYDGIAEYTNQAIKILSILEKTSVERVVDGILHPKADILRLRVEGIKGDELSIRYTKQVITSLEKLFYYGAAYQRTKRIYLPSRQSKTGSKFVTRQCLFGQTFRGSFGFTIRVELDEQADTTSSDGKKAPVPTSDTSDEYDDESFTVNEDEAEFESEPTGANTPFCRKVTERIFRGLTHVQSASIEKSTEPIVGNFESGFNANMCEAVTLLFGAIDSTELEFKFDWSPKVESPLAMKSTSGRAIKLTNSVVDVLQKSAGLLKKQEPKSEFVTFTGEVVNAGITADVGRDDVVERERKVVLQGIDSKDILKRTQAHVTVFLDPEHFKAACGALGTNARISLRGQLVKTSKGYYLEKPEGFTLV